MKGIVEYSRDPNIPPERGVSNSGVSKVSPQGLVSLLYLLPITWMRCFWSMGSWLETYRTPALED